MSISELAVVNAKDMILVQPEGPYLLGGHSFGGTLVMEIAMLLESWGKEVEFVFIFDTPVKEQSKPGDPDAPRATAADMNEILEIIIGALGSEVVGLGSGEQHPRDSPEWKDMNLHQRLEFLQPLWSVMSGRPLSLEECRQGLEFVALNLRRQNREEDMRRHTFCSNSISAKVIFFRATLTGAVTSFTDDKYGEFPMGASWYRYCEDLQIIDIPGNHFSILRQEEEDMHYVVAALKQALGMAGWVHTVHPEGKMPSVVLPPEVEGLHMDDFAAELANLGVHDPQLIDHLKDTLEPINEATLGAMMSTLAQVKGVVPINAAARVIMLTEPNRARSPLPEYSDEDDEWDEWDLEMEVREGVISERPAPVPVEVLRLHKKAIGAREDDNISLPTSPLSAREPCGSNDFEDDLPVVVLCTDANGGISGLETFCSIVQVPIFAVTLPLDEKMMEEVTTLTELAELVAKAARAQILRRRPGARLLMAGVGFGGVVAFEAAAWLQSETGMAYPLLLFDGLGTVLEHLEAFFWMVDEEDEELDELAQTVAVLYPTMLEAQKHGKPVLTKEGFAARLYGLETFEAKLDWIATHKPPEMPTQEWDDKIHELLLRLSYYRTLTASYHPKRHCPGECFLFASYMEDRVGGSLMQEGGPGGCWQTIASACLPVEVLAFPPGACRGEMSEHVPEWVSSNLVENVVEGAVAENWAPGYSAPPVPDPNWRPLPRVLELWDHRMNQHEGEDDVEQGSPSSGDTDGDASYASRW